MKHVLALLLGASLAAAPLSLGWLEPEAPTAHAGPVLGDPNLIADVAEKVTPSVVTISSTQVVAAASSPFHFDPFFDEFFGRRFPRNQERHGLGSGVIVSGKGYILTNNHVIANAKDIKVTLADGREVEATVVGADPASDLAVLKLKGKVTGLKPLPLGDSSRLRLGEVVLAIGNPYGVGQTVTMGIVSAKGRSNMGIVDYEDFIQTDAAINPGNSGGALVNLRGELVGINTAIFSRSGGYQGIGFAIPTNMARPIMNSLISTGKVVRGWLGVSIQNVTRELSDALGLSTDRGVLISGVVDGSPAEKADLRRGDVVLKIDGRETRRANDLRNAVASAGAGKRVELEILRSGKRQTVAVVLGEIPSADERVAGRGAPGAERGTPAEGLGVRVAPLTRANRQRYDIGRDVTQGVVVTGVQPDSLAAEIGLREGDVILEVNRTAVKSARQLEQAYRKGGRKVALLIHRGGGTFYVMVTK